MTTAKSLTYLAGLAECELIFAGDKLRLTVVVVKDSRRKKYGYIVDGVTPVTACAYLQVATAAVRDCIEGGKQLSDPEWQKTLDGINQARRAVGLGDLRTGCEVLGERSI